MARGRPERRENKGKKQDRSKSKQKYLKYFHYHKEGYFKRDCPEMKIKIKEAKKKTENAAIATKKQVMKQLNYSLPKRKALRLVGS